MTNPADTISAHDAATAAAWESPRAEQVDGLQAAGRNITIFGFSGDGRWAAIVDRDAGQVTVANAGGSCGLGRWECSIEHFYGFLGLYVERFPLR